MKRLILVLVLLISTSISAQTVEVLPATPAAKAVRAIANVSADVRNVYAPAGYRLLWTRNGRPTSQALTVIHLLETADAKGLNPADYDAGRWQARTSNLTSDASLAELDVTLTAAAMRYASDLRVGRVNPQSVDFDFDIEAKKFYLPALIWQLASGDPATVLASVEPQHDDYKRLLTALATWRRIANESAGEASLPVVTKLSPGDDYAALPQLAVKLRRMGDLSAAAQISGTRYEGAIVDAVKHFQSRHGLDADGVVSRMTFAQLNVPLSRRVAQIELALERWRWTPAPPAGPSIVVNIPEFRLTARDAQGELTMRVVVGKSASSETPVFGGEIRH
ncbi:MAG TPA: peptidoglycan-binding protein, partial [Thermoanaerobaculia bacterium]|nr:peptidoglycan-binding protein [Thermoanaerobaculia bacterium]